MEINALQDDPYFSLKVNRYEFGKYLFSLPDLDTLEINGKTYHDVYFLADVSVDPSVISPDSVFYTAENGIIQISLSNGEAFHLHN
jgi:hypothetical protein